MTSRQSFAIEKLSGKTSFLPWGNKTIPHSNDVTRPAEDKALASYGISGMQDALKPIMHPQHHQPQHIQTRQV